MRKLTPKAIPVGSKNLPFTNQEYWEKFDGCAKEIISEQNYHDLCKNLENFTSLGSISNLMKRIDTYGHLPGLNIICNIDFIRIIFIIIQRNTI